MNLRKIRLLTLVVLLSQMLVACGVAGEASLSVTGTPLRISVNTNGEITFSVEPGIKFPTPLGEVEIGLVVDPSDYFRSQNPQGILTVRFDGKDNFYDLNGYDFDLNFESGYYKQVNLRKSGANLLLELVKLEATPEPQVVVIVISPTSPPFIAPTLPKATSAPETSNQSSSPEQFIRSYFNVLMSRDYDTAWSMLSPKFQSNHNYSEYTSWWNTIDKLEILLMNTQSENDSVAYVYVEVHYYYKSGDITTGHTTYKLVKNGNSWLFDPN